MKKEVLMGLLVALFVATFMSPFASGSPDGLERVAEDKGFLVASEGKEAITSPMPDYLIGSIENETISGSLAGIVGTCLTFGLMYGIGKVVTTKKR